MTLKLATAFNCLISQAVLYLLLWQQKTIRFSRYTGLVVKKIQGNRNKICGYKMTKLVRSYSVAKGQEGLTVHFQWGIFSVKAWSAYTWNFNLKLWSRSGFVWKFSVSNICNDLMGSYNLSSPVTAISQGCIDSSKWRFSTTNPLQV